VTEPRESEADQTLRDRLEDRVAIRRQGPKLTLDMLGDVLFELDSAELRPQARLIIGSVAQQLSQYSSTFVNVNGFTDTSGSSGHNLQLSYERAKAVAGELARHGVDPHRIRAQGYGPNSLAVPTPEGVREARNRRVEIVLQDISSEDSR
jgi:outer membrane protein OmpA-like peptidoglycan-associated protein